ncbi:hypothetical protein GCM10010331_69760 [Streptomyces xanthochromogenes]|uniref:hypothetical protein n=1 Tax=Streptomyces xanthochromogenes TaxID=67384 RepID=UPI001672407C|nr:hypothetical protein [Streptomyces xanthochromogenes]GHB71817.1 hypothetical protein GCM10010331_69760 [Streptomyces xanthochromogenes]
MTYLFDHTAIVSLGSGNPDLSRIVLAVNLEDDQIHVPALSLVAAFQERPGAAHHVLMLDAFAVTALDAVGIAAAEEAMAQGRDWRFAQARALATDITTPRPVFVFTSAPEAYEGTAAVPVPLGS